MKKKTRINKKKNKKKGRVLSSKKITLKRDEDRKQNMNKNEKSNL